MTSADRSTRLSRGWVRRYTAGLPVGQGAIRRAEIDSDLAEHRRYRELQGWTAQQIGHERLTRLARGMASDLGWRRDVLRGNANRSLEAALTAVTGLASLLLAAFHFAFATYLLGQSAIASQLFPGGLVGYEENGPISSAIGATGSATFGLVLVVSAFARPISPLMANIATASIAVISVVMFWLGIWPIGLIAIIGAVADLTIRAPQTPPA